MDSAGSGLHTNYGSKVCESDLDLGESEHSGSDAPFFNRLQPNFAFGVRSSMWSRMPSCSRNWQRSFEVTGPRKCHFLYLTLIALKQCQHYCAALWISNPANQHLKLPNLSSTKLIVQVQVTVTVAPCCWRISFSLAMLPGAMNMKYGRTSEFFRISIDWTGQTIAQKIVLPESWHRLLLQVTHIHLEVQNLLRAER